MTTSFNMNRDICGSPAYAPAFSDTTYSCLLVSGVAQTFTVPSDAKSYIVSFYIEPGSSVWVAMHGTPVAPTGAVSRVYCEGNPGARCVPAGATLTVITSAGPVEFGASFYAIR
jgi:hypothetical protein